MQLSRLHLSGFKSFADETTLEFGAGITAVVGPNGSGKSNIVDALLWCLGERSNKALRGQNASDVIFAGTQTRRATGRAEVNLFFSNESGALPLPHKEVQVSRVLLRDGKGEYGLCGAKCRLRDVLDLFLDTGVGPDTLCIISQGEIDAILSAKPEDRRGLIEGAAGIQKYHARRSETRKKLERVEADLTRVRDIVAELSAQLVPLEAQATLAREYDGLAARLKALQLAVLWRDYELKAAKVAELSAKQAESAAKVGAARTQIGELERGEVAGTERLRASEGEVEALSARLTELVGEQKGAEGELAVARERAKALLEIQEFAAREAGVLRARLEGVGGEVEAARAALDEATRAAGALSGQAAEAEARLGEATAQLSDATRDLGALQARQLATLRAGQAAREAAATGRARMENERARLGELGVLAQNLGAELDAARSGEANAGAALATLKTKLQTARAGVEMSRAAWETSKRDAQKVADELAKMRENRSSVGARARVLRELEQNLEGVQGGARAMLEAVRRGDLPSDYLPVADAIRAPAHLEVAVEVALGGSVHNLLCPDDQSARRGVAYLKERRAGRATFLPLASLQASFLGERTQRLLGEPGVLGVASELVECKAEHDVAVGYLLNRFIVVETLEDALRLAKRCEGGARLVSLEGDLVLPAGAITGGAGKQKAGGLLARKREIGRVGGGVGGFCARIGDARRGVIRGHRARRGGARSVARGAKCRKRGGPKYRARRTRNRGRHPRNAPRARPSRGGRRTNSRIARATVRARRPRNRRGTGRARIRTGGGTFGRGSRARGGTSGAQTRGARSSARRRSGRARAVGAKRRTIGSPEAGIGGIREVGARLGHPNRRQGRPNRARPIRKRRSRKPRERAPRASQNARRTARGIRRTIGNGAHGARRGTRRIGTSRRKAESDARIAARRRGRTAPRRSAPRRNAGELREIERRLREEFGAQEVGSERLEVRESPSLSDSGKGNLTSNLSLLTSEARRAALEEIDQLSAKIGDLGQVNPGAVAQYDALKERLDFLTEQRTTWKGRRAS